MIKGDFDGEEKEWHKEDKWKEKMRLVYSR